MAVMVKISFDSKWVDLVMSCVTTVEFLVLINGQPRRRFKPSRGLRQGDPFLPYLFLIVNEVSSLLRKASDMGYIEGVKICANGPCLSHLLFADDTLIFLK